tara:strand:+ start:2335 stop:4671 length:2337 start_codon:yes stop_codon:yes gene_type:complete
MARQSIVNQQISGIRESLSQILTAGTAQTEANRLVMSRSLISNELSTSQEELKLLLEAFEKQQIDFQTATGRTFTPADRTEGFDKYVSDIQDPAYQQYENKINETRQAIANLEANINDIDELLLGPVAAARGFFKGAVDPSFSGDPNIIDAEDWSVENFKAMYPEEAEMFDKPGYLQGALSGIEVRSGLDKIGAEAAYTQTARNAIAYANEKAISDAGQILINPEALRKQAEAINRNILSSLDPAVPLSSGLNDITNATAAFQLARDVLLKAPNQQTNKNALEEARKDLEAEKYAVGNAIMGLGPTVSEYRTAIDYNYDNRKGLSKFGISEEGFNDIVDAGEELYNAVVQASIPASQNGTHVPYVRQLSQIYDFISGREDVDWELIDRYTGFDQAEFEETLPGLVQSLYAVDVIRKRISAELTRNVDLSEFLKGTEGVDDPDEIDITDLIKQIYGSLPADTTGIDSTVVDSTTIDTGLLPGNLPESSVDPVTSQTFMGGFANNFREMFDSINPLDIGLDITGQSFYQPDFDSLNYDSSDTYYMSSAQNEYLALRALVERKDTLETIVADWRSTHPGRGRGSLSEREEYYIYADAVAELQGTEGRKAGGLERLFSSNMDLQIRNAKKELFFKLRSRERETKTLRTHAIKWDGLNPDLINTWTQILDVPADTPLYTLDIDELAEAIAQSEGWNEEGSLAQKRSNPGNLLYMGQKGAIRGDDGFAIFDSVEVGWQALLNQLALDMRRSENYWADEDNVKRERMNADSGLTEVLNNLFQVAP